MIHQMQKLTSQVVFIRGVGAIPIVLSQEPPCRIVAVSDDQRVDAVLETFQSLHGIVSVVHGEAILIHHLRALASRVVSEGQESTLRVAYFLQPVPSVVLECSHPTRIGGSLDVSTWIIREIDV